MTLVKKQYNGRELPVFDNMDEATEYFARRRKTIYKGISALLLVFSVILGIIVALFQPSLFRALLSVILLAVGGLYCIIDEPKIRAPKQFMVFYSKEEGKWLLFPVNKYPAVAFVRESELDKEKNAYIAAINEKQLEINVKKEYLLIAGCILMGVLLPINAYAACAVAIIAAFAKIVIQMNSDKEFRIMPHIKSR